MHGLCCLMCSALDIQRFICLCGDSFALSPLQAPVGMGLLLSGCRVALRPVYGSEKEMNGGLVRAFLFGGLQVRQSILLLAAFDQRPRAIHPGLHQIGTKR